MSSSPWLVSARFDVLAFSVPALLGLLVGALSGQLAEPGGDTPAWAWLLFVVGVDVAHVHATTLRVYLDRAELARRPTLYIALPLLSLGAGMLLYSHSAALFWRCLAYIALFHFVRQQLGWMRLYRKRSAQRQPLDRGLDELAIYAATLSPVVVWHTRLPTPFHWFMPGDFIAGLPSSAAVVAVCSFVAVACVFGVRQLQLRLRGEPLAWGKILLFATTSGTWWGGIVVMANDFAFTVTNVVAHGVPYMLVSHRVACSQQQLAPQARRWYLPGLSLYLLALAGLALAEEWLWDACVWHEHASLLATPMLELDAAAALFVPLLSVPQLTHYLLDAFLWRLDGHNPALAAWLRQHEPAPSHS